MSRVLKTGINQITQSFGNNGHTGTDIVKKTNQLDYIVTHSQGTVVMTQTGQKNNPGSAGNASYGNFVKIKHPNGYFTLYAHLDSVSVKTGQNVSKGQTIGFMGNTGNSYGAHLHFEVRNQLDNNLNSNLYVDSDLPNLPTEEDMTKAEVEKIVHESVAMMAGRLTQAEEELVKLKKTYAFIEDVPEWYREAVEYYVATGIIKGKGIHGGKVLLDLTPTECRMVTIMYRITRGDY